MMNLVNVAQAQAEIRNPTAAGSPSLLDAAARISARICAASEWANGRCTFPAYSPAARHRFEWTVADSRLYAGTSGTALFLAEFARATGDSQAARHARGAIRHALFVEEQVPAAIGFYTGTTGVAYSAWKCGEIFDDDSLRAAARRMLRPLESCAAQDARLDLLSGAAGAIPALLMLTEYTGDAEWERIAGDLGRKLLATAEVNALGYCWMQHWRAAQPLAGFSHGAAGIAYGLLELFNRFGLGKYSFAAEQAIRYENLSYSEDERNWADWRSHELDEFLTSDVAEVPPDSLVQMAKTGRQAPKYMSAWCHGAPGIGLARLRAYHLTGGAALLADARRALEDTMRSLAHVHNHSLCHGMFGNIETLLLTEQVLGHADLAEKARSFAEEAVLTTREPLGERWLGGAPGGITDSGLMLGLAGIGHGLLRASGLAEPLLMLTPRIRQWPSLDPDGSGRSSARQFIGRNFPDLDHVNREDILNERQLALSDICAGSSIADKFMAAFDAKRGNWTRVDEAARVSLAQVSASADRAHRRFELVLRLRHSIGLRPTLDDDLVLSPGVRVVEFEDGQTAHLVRVRSGTAEIVALPPGAGAALGAFSQPNQVARACTWFAEHTAISRTDVEQIFLEFVHWHVGKGNLSFAIPSTVLQSSRSLE